MTMAFTTLSLCEIFHSVNLRSRNKSIISVRSFNKYLLGAIVLTVFLTVSVVFVPGLNSIFKLESLPVDLFAWAALLAVAIIPVVEFEKLLTRSLKSVSRKKPEFS
jgi:Ca2+-transporting ATPase